MAFEEGEDCLRVSGDLYEALRGSPQTAPQLMRQPLRHPAKTVSP